MWNNLFHQPIVLNEEAFIDHYNKCLNAVFERVIANIAASGLPPEDFLAANSKLILAETQAVKNTFMRMVSFPDEMYFEDFGVRLSKILLGKLHHFTHQSVKKSALPGYN
jgi:hypothetical protein